MSSKLELDEKVVKTRAQTIHLPLRRKTVSVKQYNKRVAKKAKTTKPILYNFCGILVFILVIVNRVQVL